MTYKDPDKQKAFQRVWQREQRMKKRLAVIKKLGGKCKRCGFNKNFAALQLDHIQPIFRSRTEDRCNQTLIRNIYNGSVKPDNIQLLCANCHAIKTYEEDRKTFKNYQVA